MFRLAFNVLKPGPWQDPRVRRAISLWIDRDATIPVALGGFGWTTPSLGPPNRFKDKAYVVWPTFDREPLADRRAEAKRLMAEAGYSLGFSMGHLCRARQSTGCQLLQAPAPRARRQPPHPAHRRGRVEPRPHQPRLRQPAGPPLRPAHPGGHRGRLRHLLRQPRLLRQARGPQGLRALPPPPRGHPPRAPPRGLAPAPALHLRRPDLRSPHSGSHLRSPLPNPRKRPNRPPRRRPHPHRLRHRLARPPRVTLPVRPEPVEGPDPPKHDPL